MSKVDQAAKPPQILWKLAPPKTKSIRLTAAPEKKTIQGISGRGAQKRAIQGGARVPDFATLQTGKKHGILYIARFSKVFRHKTSLLRPWSAPENF
jgi:hypothetical protein